jgi:glycosyltransferase involved in cell wall biosynthesis
MLSGAEPAPASKLRRLAARDERVWRGADGYVTITAGLRDELSRRFGHRPRVAVVPDGVTLPASISRPPASSGFTIGYAGHLYPWKGVDLVIEAIAGIPDSRGLIVGGHDREPDLDRIRKLADTLFCSGRTTFTGMVAPVDVAARLREADVLVLPNPATAISRAFTSPLKLFEYMASGTPIVASDLPAIREVLTHERNAILVEPGNPQSVTAGVRRIKDDPALGARLAAQALEDVREYTWARRAARLETLFDEVVE